MAEARRRRGLAHGRCLPRGAAEVTSLDCRWRSIGGRRVRSPRRVEPSPLSAYGCGSRLAQCRADCAPSTGRFGYGAPLMAHRQAGISSGGALFPWIPGWKCRDRLETAVGVAPRARARMNGSRGSVLPIRARLPHMLYGGQRTRRPRQLLIRDPKICGTAIRPLDAQSRQIMAISA